ncbi:MAG: hypothetical protein ABJ205_07635 [Erythrobacter sp.]
METKDIQPLLDAEIDAVVGGIDGTEPIGFWDDWRPPWWGGGESNPGLPQ